MGISDLITIFGLILAVAAIIEDKERRLIILKFHRGDALFFVIGFLFINYLIFFDTFQKWGLYSSHFLTPLGITPNIWAYLISLVALTYLFYKIWFSKFPKSNTLKVLEFFKTLRQDSEFSFLMRVITKYNKSDIMKYLKSRKSEKFELEKKLFEDFLATDEFVSKIAATNPYFFIPIFRTFNEKGWVEEEMVQTYLATIFEGKNEFLFREIKNNQNFSNHFRYGLPEENEILVTLFKDIKFAENNSVWKPIGETTLNILEEERGKKGRDFLNTSYDDAFHDEKTALWKSHLYVAIWYFDIMIRESIYQNPSGHMFLYYYEYFTRRICSNIYIDPENRINEKAEFPTFYHYCLFTMISNMRYWIDCVVKSKNDSLLKNIVDCLGNCLEIVVKCPVITEKFKTYIFGMPIRTFLETHKDPIHIEVRKHLKEKLMNYSEWVDPHLDYYRFQVFAWNEFDKVPYENEWKKPILDEFRNEVISNASIKGQSH